MDKMNEDAVNMSVVCPIIRDMRCNKCDYPQLRRELSSQTRERCACAGKEGDECVLRCIQVVDGNIVQRLLYYQEFKSQGDKDPMVEIRQAIRAYEKKEHWFQGLLAG